MCEAVEDFGYTRLALKSDNEPALLALVQESLRTIRFKHENTRTWRCSPQSRVMSMIPRAMRAPACSGACLPATACVATLTPSSPTMARGKKVVTARALQRLPGNDQWRVERCQAEEDQLLAVVGGKR